MSERMLKVLPLGVFGSLIAVLTAGFTPAQEPIPLFPPGAPPPKTEPMPEPLPLPLPGQPGHPTAPVVQANAEAPEVLAKGPVHEGFAVTAEAPTASPIVPKQPPEPVEELPPDQKPAGDNVQWIPGYWHWDEEVSKYIWISGFWRQPPPGRVWVPGSWREAKGGWQWVSGFWQAVQPQPGAQPNQPAQPEVEYLPQQPPESIESGPTVPAPGEGYFYAPGSWVWRNRYVWRPGVWVEHRANWLWVPSRYHWTPAGYVYCEGYWDYPLATRGVLFAPVAFVRPIPPTFVYTPAYVVSEPCMVGALFVRRGCNNYFFGDYFDRGYGALGYSAWCGTVTRGGFSIGFGVGRTWGYDPLWSYYSVTHRATPTWHRGVGDLYGGRYRGDLTRPPTTLVQQNTVINNITRVNVNNVTNNINVVNGAATVGNRDVSNVAMVAPLRVAPDLQRTRFENVAADARRNEATAARQLRDVGVQRTRLETAAAAQPQPQAVRPAPGVAAQVQPAQPRSIKFDVPQAAVTRAQVNDERKGPPPNPVRPSASVGAKVDPPRVNVPQPGVGAPKFETKLPNPSPAPVPKVDPPRVNVPSPQPKVDPRPNPLPVPAPKVDPPRPSIPQPAPSVAPKVALPRPNPQPAPKVEPPRVNVPTPAPKVEPPRVNIPQPAPPKPNPQPAPAPPKVDPPRVNIPQPAPKVDPPRVNVPPPAPRPNPAPVPPPAPKVNPAPPAPKPAAPVAQPAPKVNPAPKVQPPVAAPRPPAPAPQPPKAAPPAPRPAAPAPQPPRAAPQPPKAPPQAPRPAPNPPRKK